MDDAPTTGIPMLPTLESVLCTEELNRRPVRPPDYEREIRAQVSLVHALTNSPHTILQALADTILEVLQADSAGISLVTEDGKRFYWPAIAGVWKPYIGGGTPRNFGPCGDVLDRNGPLLFKHFERRYSYFLPVTPPVEECLLVPFYVEGKAVGTIWAIAHDDRRKFDNEDLRMLVNLGTFASATYQVVEQSRALSKQSQERQEDTQAMREINEKLVVSSVRQHELAERAHKAEAELRDSADRLRQSHAVTEGIVDTVRESLLVLDTDLRVRMASRSFYESFRVSSEETINRLLYDLGNSQWDIPELRRVLEEVQHRDNQVNNFEMEYAFEHIGTRTMLLNARRLFQSADRPPLILLAIEDVTERKRMENDLLQVAADLSEADRRKNEFLALLAHELRNPLAPIRSVLQILRLTEGTGAAVQSACAMMERQVAQLVRLVDDLLDVNRISLGKIELRRERIELASLIHHAVEAARSLVQCMEHDLNVTLPPQPIYLNADPTRLAQVVGNLLNNACKFTDKGGRIGLTVEHEGEQAVIRVRDNGIGIAADQLPRIFEMFMQVDTSLERAVDGLGIGLTLVKRLVEMHGGTVEVHSAGVGQGSEFVVRLPIMVETPKSLPPEPTTSGPTPKIARRILVVDDNRDSATALATLLNLAGNETHTAYDGLEAVEEAATFRPDVVLLDIGLPKLNGYEAARRIRGEPWGKSIVLVALTGLGRNEDVQKSRDAGFNGHLVKPADLAAFLKLLASLPSE